MKLHLRQGQRHLELEVQREGEGYTVAIDGRTRHVRRGPGDTLVIDGVEHRIMVSTRGDRLFSAVGPSSFTFVRERRESEHALDSIVAPELTAPMPGKVTQVLVEAGAKVSAGDPLILLEAMKMENRLLAEADGTVAEIKVAAGDMVDGGQVLLVMEYAG